MAIRYILAQFNEKRTKIVLSPKELKVRHGDQVVWISRLDEGETYVASDFVGNGQLFKDDSYTMPGIGESDRADVIADPSVSEAWTYTCSEELSINDVSDGDSGQGIIIVDPPPIDDDKDQKSGGREKIPVAVR